MKVQSSDRLAIHEFIIADSAATFRTRYRRCRRRVPGPDRAPVAGPGHLMTGERSTCGCTGWRSTPANGRPATTGRPRPTTLRTRPTPGVRSTNNPNRTRIRWSVGGPGTLRASSCRRTSPSRWTAAYHCSCPRGRPADQEDPRLPGTSLMVHPISKSSSTPAAGHPAGTRPSITQSNPRRVSR